MTELLTDAAAALVVVLTLALLDAVGPRAHPAR